MSRVLIVDDSAYMRTTMRDVLVDNGHKIVGEVGEGTHVLKFIKETTPDILLLDIILPGLIGLDIIKIVKSSYPDIKIIIVSVLEDLSIQNEAMGSGASAYIIKPVTEKLLNNAIYACLN